MQNDLFFSFYELDLISEKEDVNSQRYLPNYDQCYGRKGPFAQSHLPYKSSCFLPTSHTLRTGVSLAVSRDTASRNNRQYWGRTSSPLVDISWLYQSTEPLRGTYDL